MFSVAAGRYVQKIDVTVFEHLDAIFGRRGGLVTELDREDAAVDLAPGFSCSLTFTEEPPPSRCRDTTR